MKKAKSVPVKAKSVSMKDKKKPLELKIKVIRRVTTPGSWDC